MIGGKHNWITKIVLMTCFLFLSGLLFLIKAVDGDTPTVEVVPAQILDPGTLERPLKGNPKLGSSLNQLLEVYNQKGTVEAQTFSLRRQLIVSDERVQVTIITSENEIDQVRHAVEAAGGQYELHYRNRLQVMLPVGVLDLLSSRSDVHLIREPRRALPDDPVQYTPMAGDQTSEGVSASNADAWHAAGYNGSGVRVAIIDEGFTGYAGLLGKELPDVVSTYNWARAGLETTKHGTACAELTFDMAPGIEMDLHKVSTTVELGKAVRQAIADGVDIISMSLGWPYDGQGDGTGPLADIVKQARSSGIFFTKSAGNQAEKSWSGTFTDQNGDDEHEWVPGAQDVNYFGSGNGRAYVIPAGEKISVYLFWNDWTAVDQDYNLYLLYWNGSSWRRVASSEDLQDGRAGQTPEESINYMTSLEGPYGVQVEKYRGTRNVCFRMQTYSKYRLDERVPARSFSFPADSPDAITVGAVGVGSYDLESYSSRGPTFGPGGDCDGGAAKPDLVAYARVSTISEGWRAFAGTSAAAPHVAGAAALLKAAFPAYTVDQLQGYLETEAVDLGDTGKDNRYGSGRLYLGRVRYTVNFNVGAGGAISGDRVQLISDGGDCSPVTAVPDTGYQFTQWTGAHTGTKNPLTITNVRSNMTITANFEKNDINPVGFYRVAFLAGPNGSISGESSQSVRTGGNCSSVTAVPNAGYRFTRWTGDYAGAQNPLTITNIGANMTITANFEAEEEIQTSDTSGESSGGGGGGGCFVGIVSEFQRFN